MNKPYVKVYDKDGNLMNPIDGFYFSRRITEDHPFGYPNRSERRRNTVNQRRLFNNKKGTQLVVTKLGNKFFKYKKEFQKIGKKRVLHIIES